jgi:DNA modification methylase
MFIKRPFHYDCEMKTNHKIYFKTSTKMEEVPSDSIDLIVTSPPYPMIEMWDDIFSQQAPLVKSALDKGNGAEAFELMHQLLDLVWHEAFRILRPGGFACINIGDATRTINGRFVLYPNHMRILKCMLELGFAALPCVLWRKQTNAPNKFMGSGMLPAGAYVTLEHEYILILRKGPKREFKSAHDKKRRHESAIFWEERNVWYSDVWFDVKGTLQALNDKEARKRSGAYPFEVVYRLINMYSAKRDLVLDPFMGTGTTMAAAVASGRNCVGYEIDISMRGNIINALDRIVDYSNEYIAGRIKNHLSFVKSRVETNKQMKYLSRQYRFPVITSQEREILFNEIISSQRVGRDSFEITYSDEPQKYFVLEDSTDILIDNLLKSEKHVQSYAKFKRIRRKSNQLTLFN